jgi:hypothetical protein
MDKKAADKKTVRLRRGLRTGIQDPRAGCSPALRLSYPEPYLRPDHYSGTER